MNFIQLAKERYSIRKFSDKKIEKEKLDLILEAGRVAPTAANFQSQRILVIENEENLAKLKSSTRYYFNAPLALLVCYDSTVSWKRDHDNEDSGIIDASIVATQMMLQIHELGLGTAWVGNFNLDIIKKDFELPDYIIPVVLFQIGYPSNDSTPSKNHYKRYDINDTVFFNSFQGITPGSDNKEKH